MLTNTTATVFNRWKNAAAGRWEYRKTILPAVHWEPRKGVSIGTGGMTLSLVSENDKASIYIPMTPIAGKAYTNPVEYESSADPSPLWTLDVGNGYITRGALESAPSTATEADMKAIRDSNPECYLIGAVATHDYGRPHMRHWEVTGR